MVECRYKKTCIKDLAHIPKTYREKIAKIIFHDIPQADDIWNCGIDIAPMRGYPGYYRVRIGTYRIGLVFDCDVLIFYRIKTKEEIYSVFP